MKKIIKRLAISTLIILLFSSLLFLMSCRDGGGGTARKIEQTALYRGKELQIKVKVYKYNIAPLSSFKKFYSKANFVDMKKAILKKYPNAEISEENHNLFIKLPYKNSSQKAYFLIVKTTDITDKGDFIYYTYNLENSIDKDGYSYFTSFLMPMYMFHYDGSKESVYNLSISNDQEYEISNTYDLEDVYHFYKDSGYFQIKKTDNSIILEKLIWDEDTPIPDYYVLPSPITISYRAENNKHYIAYSMEKNKDE